MSNRSRVTLSRREFIKAGLASGAGLTLGLYVPQSRGRMTGAGPGKAGSDPVADPDFAPNAFVRIGTDDTVTVVVKHLEMGQGTYTGLPTLAAEELDAAWSQVQPVGAPADADRYANLLWGDLQGTGGSTAIANSYQQMRKAGAAAREMLVAAGAQRWQVPAAEIRVREGVVSHEPSGRRASFGELAEAAAQQPVPEQVFLKDPEQFRLIGSHVPRKDDSAKVRGRAVFTQDVQLDGMLTAVVARPPRFGARVKGFDASKARQVKGVTEVVEIPTGVAVLGEDFWSARQGRDALSVEWDDSEAVTAGSAELMERYREMAAERGAVARHDGDPEAATDEAEATVEAEYEFPYLAHAALEPLNCVVRLTDDGCEIWNGEQYQTADQQAVARLLGIEPDQVRIHMLYAGGSFGRRANPHSDYVVEAVTIARAIEGKAPVKMVWTREDDMQAGYFRPMYYHRMQGGVDADGSPVGWRHRIVGQSIMAGTLLEDSMVKDGVDQTSVEGAANMPYAVPNVGVDLHSPRVGIPVQWWRSVGSTHTAFVVETFMDELAEVAGRDPVELRRSLLEDHPRWRGVLDLVADKGGWGEQLGKGRGRGVAVHQSFNTYVAQVADVTVSGDGGFTVDRVVIAVDCGVAVNPDIVRAQMEGGVGFGLSAALMSEITVEDGRVQQSNFHDYRVLRMEHMPRVQVHIVASDQSPTGVGEPAVPVIAPAVANALYRATGKRLRRLPLRL